ncbi:LuxE/PaaK family acyltransferase [Grimontia marina]|uniref:Acyl-protein synthetase, LuxE n=1 Tax=Grimontia marina TaxID=646534 RepID=A0A128FBV3_9GAMM|nr:LuxE family acyl-protein synthetase [Grimontia marina]CZF83751.1 Acyl-protein synthetase, LuxE [Grimontia marina]
MGTNLVKQLDGIKSLGLSPIKVMLASIKELYSLPEADLNDCKLYLVKDSFSHHYNVNDYYRGLCDKHDVKPDDIQTFNDLVKIPLIPVSEFKASDSHKLLSVGLNEVELEVRSTGTSGVPSVSRRCSNTIDNVLLGIGSMYREFFGISKGACLFLCPPPEEIPEMGLVRLTNLMSGMLDTHEFMVKGGKFEPEPALEKLKKWEGKFDRHIMAPPFLVMSLISYLKENGIKLSLDKNSLLITVGGWKRYTGQMISQSDFNKACMTYFGIESGQIRDTYGLTESNIFSIDDEFSEKYVAPIGHFSVRNIEDPSSEVEDGEVGRLAIYDPMALSTPGFVLTEDLVRILPGKSKSGRGGQRFEYIGRWTGSTEFGCCAVNIDRHLNQKDAETVE